MFVSILPTNTKTEAANSSTTLVSSYKRVCQNSDNNLNNTHHAKKKRGNIHCVHHNLLWNEGTAAIKLDLGTRPL